jgi:hypothetical protein
MDTTETEQRVPSVELTDDDVIQTGKYVKADDLASAGERTVTVKGMRIDTFRGGEKKEVIHFEDGSALTLNATRKQELADIAGNPIKVSAVKGMDLVLVPSKTMFQGKKVNSISLKKAAKGPF